MKNWLQTVKAPQRFPKGFFLQHPEAIARGLLRVRGTRPAALASLRFARARAGRDISPAMDARLKAAERILTAKLNRAGSGEIFVRIGKLPFEDLRRGISYSWGAFGEADQAHEGLSGYNASFYGSEYAIEKLAHYWDERGGVNSEASIAIYRGSQVGTGPDQEDLFRPSRLLAIVRVKDWYGHRNQILARATNKLDAVLDANRASGQSPTANRSIGAVLGGLATAHYLGTVAHRHAKQIHQHLNRSEGECVTWKLPLVAKRCKEAGLTSTCLLRP